MEQGYKFYFGNSQKGIVIRCLDNARNLYEIIYHQNNLKYVKQDAYYIDDDWELSDESGRVVHASEYPSLIRALEE